jgi:signal transduction histidine kinase
MYVPLVVKEEVVGLLVLNYHEPGYYTPYHAQLAQAVGTQVATAIENARLYDQAQDIAALEERQRLARELHDSTSQVLFSIQLGSRALRNFLQEEQLSEAKETVNYLIALAKGGLDEMRALIFDLRPESIEKEGLLGALQKQIVALKDRYNLELEVRFSRETEPELPLKYKEAIYRVAREALHNVVKHASTERVELELTWDSQAIRLVVRDYGIGFEPDGDFTGHYGLHTMQERAQKLPGANLSIESKPGEGARVCLDVPLPRLSLSQAARD